VGGIEIDIDWRRLLTVRGRMGRGGFFKLAWLPLLVVVIPTWWSMLNAPDGGEAYDSAFFGGFAFSAVLAFVSVRRLHDVGKPGWWSLILVAPFILAYLPVVSILLLTWPIILFLWLLLIGSTEGDRGPNAYGWPGSGSPFPDERRAGMPPARRGR
jgi:uncharacterized membrane protein YhaH (DUF805 family)